jgi:histidinol-phosphate phosphatase family protein
MTQRVIFLDRDGTINEDPAEARYVFQWDDFKFKKGVLEAAAKLKRSGFKLAVVSNQAGVGGGLMTQADLDDISARMKQAFAEAGAPLDAVHYCTAIPESNDKRRKPNPGMLVDVSKELDADAAQSYMIGDSEKDIEAAKAFGCRSILVLDGKTKKEDVEAFRQQPDYIAKSVQDAAEWILQS